MSQSKASKPKILVVLTTFPNRSKAIAVSRKLVSENLVACAQIGSPIRSVYRWKNRYQTSLEIPVSLKTQKARYKKLEARLKQLHPYSVPQILALSGQNAYQPYVKWLMGQTSR